MYCPKPALGTPTHRFDVIGEVGQMMFDIVCV